MRDHSHTSAEIGRSQPQIAVFGIGAIEQHSVHLALGTDWLGVCDVTRRVAEAMRAFLVPALPFSMSECHGPMAGTVWLRPETLAAVLRDVVESLRAQGFRRVLVINGHGGNFVLEAEIRQLNQDYPDCVTLMVPFWMPIPSPSAIWERGEGIHAMESETSHQLAINAENVRPGRVDYLPSVGREFLDYAYMGFISEWGVWGYPSYGTAEKGHRATAETIPLIVRWAEETFARVEQIRHGG